MTRTSSRRTWSEERRRGVEPLRMETLSQASARLGWSRDKVQRFIVSHQIPQYGDRPLIHEVAVLDAAILADRV